LADPYELPPYGGVVAALAVCLEDPSQHLGYLLRRLEEGTRVLVQTTARTPAGAKRLLLGTTASERAEAWLDAHEQCSLVRENGVLTLKGV
jgi:hypothetical protein